jgi:hypothetical protein
MNYLKYIELSAENLQFFLWYRDYVNRFDGLPANEKALSPEWTVEQAEAEAMAAQVHVRQKVVPPEAAAAFKGTDFANEPRVTEAEKVNPFYTPPGTPPGEDKRDVSSVEASEYESAAGGKVDHQGRAEGAFENAGLQWKPRKIYFAPFIINFY